MPRLALSRNEAAATLGLSLTALDALVSRGELRVVYPQGRGKGRRVIVPTREIERYLDRGAAIKPDR